MAEPQVITSWDQLSPVVYDEAGVAVSTRVLAEQHRKLQQQVEALTARNKLLETLFGTFRVMIDSAQQGGEE